MTKLTFIGNGNMAKSLIEGLVDTYEIEVLGRNLQSLKALKKVIPNISINIVKSEEDISNKILILCVKPYSLTELAPKLQGEATALYSVLAGTAIESLRMIKAKNYIRTMPNLSASYKKSMTTITGDIALQTSAIEIFNNIGNTLWLNSENELDIATGLAGSGPAYLALIAEALSDGAVTQGLKRYDAQILVKGLFEGFAPLLADSQYTHNPSGIKDAVMSPAGTTATGYEALERGNVRHALMSAIRDSYEKALELKAKN
jgi:pyrroline-5-carboxylate reductase